MQSIPFNLLDELFFHLDKPEDPFGMHQELRAEGRIDPERLLAAIHKAAEVHPLARAFMLPWKPTDREYRWGIADALAANPLTVVECEDEQQVMAARTELMNQSVSLEASPPFRCVLAHHPNGDYLILNMHHAISDGTGQARFLRSIVRAYADKPDPVPAFDPLSRRDLSELFGAPTLADRLRRYTPLARYLVQSLLPPSRIATEDGLEEEGFGFHLLRLNQGDVERINARRSEGATVNDVLIAASHQAIQAWNQKHKQRAERITTMMPVNIRPRDWANEVVGNYSVFVAVGSQSTDRQNFTRTLRAVVRWTSWYKETKGTTQLIELLRGAPWLPLWLKRASRDLIPLTGNRVVDSTALSNLGRLEDMGSFGGKAGKVTEFWFSPPARMPLGVAVGAATHLNELHLAFRYRKAQFGPDGAARFVELYRKVLLGEQEI